MTDVGIGIATPIWASDGVHTESDMGPGFTPLRSFDGTGRLLDRDITVEAAVVNSAIDDDPMLLYFDVAPDEATLYGSGFWSPVFISHALPIVNEEARELTASRVHNSLRDFLIPSADEEIQVGAQLEFLLRVGDLVCARITDESDPRTLAPWSIQIDELVEQRGGVTVLRNVIRPDSGEKAAIVYELDTAGMVTAQVFTLSGDVVRVLQRGRQEAGEHMLSWDGKNAGGRSVARGIYFVRVVGPNIDEYRKIIVAK
jgi:hypothetical protein